MLCLTNVENLHLCYYFINKVFHICCFHQFNAFNAFQYVGKLFGKGVAPGKIYLLKFKKINTKKRCEICSKFTIKTPERSQ